jgi:hypothetical protein
MEFIFAMATQKHISWCCEQPPKGHEAWSTFQELVQEHNETLLPTTTKQKNLTLDSHKMCIRRIKEGLCISWRP